MRFWKHLPMIAVMTILFLWLFVENYWVDPVNKYNLNIICAELLGWPYQQIQSEHYLCRITGLTLSTNTISTLFVHNYWVDPINKHNLNIICSQLLSWPYQQIQSQHYLCRITGLTLSTKTISTLLLSLSNYLLLTKSQNTSIKLNLEFWAHGKVSMTFSVSNIFPQTHIKILLLEKEWRRPILYINHSAMS